MLTEIPCKSHRLLTRFDASLSSRPLSKIMKTVISAAKKSLMQSIEGSSKDVMPVAFEFKCVPYE